MQTTCSGTRAPKGRKSPGAVWEGLWNRQKGPSFKTGKTQACSWAVEEPEDNKALRILGASQHRARRSEKTSSGARLAAVGGRRRYLPLETGAEKTHLGVEGKGCTSLHWARGNLEWHLALR